VMSGFRVAAGGAQQRFGITPDLTCLGKIIGGGLPVGAYGGREEIMRQIAPDGPVYQAGTLSGNPLAMRAGLETLTRLQAPGFYEALERQSLRLARGFTGRDKIIKFEGGYHGHADGLLVKAGSGAATFGVPDSAGVPADYARLTLTAPFNDLDAVDSLLAENHNEVACIIVEPVPGNTGVLDLYDTGFLQGLRERCDRDGIVLIFDEVMSGFRVAAGGAQQRFGITPDLTCLGKIIGGGLPVGAYGGREEIMRQIAPDGPVYQAGTLSGNPLAMRAGLETLTRLQAPGFYEALEQQSLRLVEGLLTGCKAAGIAAVANQVGAMFTLFFTDRATISNHAEVCEGCDTALFGRFFNGMLDEGIYLAPSQFEATFLSAAHSDGDIDATITAAGCVLQRLAA